MPAQGKVNEASAEIRAALGDGIVNQAPSPARAKQCERSLDFVTPISCILVNNWRNTAGNRGACCGGRRQPFRLR
jgi:hypothetical protein